MRLLKLMGMDSEGLKTFYVANVKSVITYACPAWNNLLSDTDKTRENPALCHSDYAAILKRLRTAAGQSSIADNLGFPAHLMQ